MTDLGIVQRLMLDDTQATFELVIGRQHHDQLVDVDSGQALEFRDAEIEALQHAIAKRLGYDLNDHRLVLIGRRRGTCGPG
ncbi:MAG: transcriptional repressor [Planctomycetes bacterium]|nr:transcriptional repressor [Planctomycetota bacterium]